MVSQVQCHKVSRWWICIETRLGLKAASSLRPYFSRKNCMRHGHHACTGTRYARDVACADLAAFDPMTDADAFEAADLLATSEATRTRKEFQQLAQSLGLNRTPDGIPLSDRFSALFLP